MTANGALFQIENLQATVVENPVDEDTALELFGFISPWQKKHTDTEPGRVRQFDPLLAEP